MNHRTSRLSRGERPSGRAHPCRSRCAMLVAGVLAAASPGAVAQPVVPPVTPPPQPTPAPERPAVAPAGQSGVYDGLGPELEARLGALSPANPREYFLLGEEVAAEATSPQVEGVARTLYVLAFELDRRRQAAGGSADPGLAASACLALADLSRLEEDRRWLVALARSLDRRHASPDWSRAAQPSYSGEAGFRAAEFLGLVRSGEAHRARDLLQDPEVARVLEDFERMMGGIGSSGMLREMVLQSRQWPCVQCANARIARLGETNPPRRGLCPTCGGNPGPTLTRQQLIGQLRFESALLDGIQSSWSAQMTLDQGAPLREPAPEELAPTMNVDPDAVYWRAGGWVRTPGGAGRAEPARPPPIPGDEPPVAPAGDQAP